MAYRHTTVLLHELVDAVFTDPDGVYIDCTLGGGGHTSLLLSRLSERGRVVGVDRDGDALQHVRETVRDDRLLLCKRNYAQIAEIAREFAPDGVTGILADLGVSGQQLDDAERGFSYGADAFLDMRMDRSQPLTACDVVNTYPKEELVRILRDYGEERFAGRVADRIVRAREQAPLRTTKELAAVVSAALPKQNKSEGHPCKRTFQAIRIEVNGELSGVESLLSDGVPCLKSGGRMGVISFHSLEDRLVKTAFARWENPCTCPKDFPVCVCGKKPVVRVLTRKPILPSEAELQANHRAHSAKLRCCEKL